MKIKIKDSASDTYRLGIEPDKFSWKYFHILKKLEGKTIEVKEDKELGLVSEAIYGVSILPFQIMPEVYEKV